MASEPILTSAQIRDFRCIAGMMLPASDEFGVPGADDPAIFDDILRSLGRDTGAVRNALAKLAALSGGSFDALDKPRRAGVAETFLADTSSEVTTLGRTILQCYYRDDRVLHSLGVEPRPPFPKGHTLEQGDWSLLDPVRNRAKLWRDA